MYHPYNKEFTLLVIIIYASIQLTPSGYCYRLWNTHKKPKLFTCFMCLVVYDSSSGFQKHVYKSNAKMCVNHRINAPCRPKAYRLWTQESLDEAIALVEKGTSIRRAAEMFGVPRSTLHDHASGRVQQFAK